MTTNPLLNGSPARRGRVTVDMLNELVVELNGRRFVKDTGKFYFVGRRFDGETALHFLDRRI